MCNLIYNAIRFVLIFVFIFAARPSVAGDIYAFGNGKISVPSTVGTGVILSRHYFSPYDLCGKTICEITVVALYNKGSIWTAPRGPDLETNVSGVSVRLIIDGKVVDSSFKGNFAQQAEVQLFRNSGTISDGSFASGSFNSYFLLTYKTGWLGTETGPIRLSGTVRAISGTCHVPDQTVALPPIRSGELHGAGSTAGTTRFSINLERCPAGYNRIGYFIQPLGGAFSGYAGTLDLLPGSTAAGVNIRLTDSSGAPQVFQQLLPVTAYDTQTGGSYAIPMSAAYIQTADAIRSGTVNGAVVVLLDYQ